MNIEKISKKLEEIRADTYNSVSDSEKDDFKIQIEQQDELELEEELNEPEVVKPDRPKAETRPEIKTLSRATSMDGGKGADEKIYVTDGTLKAPTVGELQNKLDSIKKVEGEERFTINVNDVSPEVFNSIIKPALEKITTATNGQVFWTDFRQSGEDFFFYIVNSPVGRRT
jgi:hypothetical protein